MDPFKGQYDPQNLPANKPCTLLFDPKNSESPFSELTVKAHLCCRDGTSEAVAVKKITPEQYSLSFVPQKRGRHELHIMYNDTHICGSPIPVYVTISPRELKQRISTKKIENSGGIKCHGGKVYLSSRSAGGILVLDCSTRSTERVIKVPGVSEILVTQKYIYAGDILFNRVLMMDKNGTVLKSVGGRGSNPGQFDIPNGIRQNGREIYVVDDKNCRIQVFDEDLNLLRVIGERGIAPHQIILAEPQY